LHDVGAMQHIEALDRRGADDLDGKPHRHRARADDVTHRRLAHREFFCTCELRVFGKRRDRLVERGAQIEEEPRPGGAVVAAPAQRLEQGVAG
jgi:hypothetical protein